jgi:hypothetical protein
MINKRTTFMHTKVQYKCTIKQQMKILKNITCALNASLVQKKRFNRRRRRRRR